MNQKYFYILKFNGNCEDFPLKIKINLWGERIFFSLDCKFFFQACSKQLVLPGFQTQIFYELNFTRHQSHYGSPFSLMWLLLHLDQHMSCDIISRILESGTYKNSNSYFLFWGTLSAVLIYGHHSPVQGSSQMFIFVWLPCHIGSLTFLCTQTSFHESVVFSVIY